MYGTTSERELRNTLQQLRQLAVGARNSGHWGAIYRGIKTIRGWRSTIQAPATTTATVSKATFKRWFEIKCTEAVEVPLDVLYGTTRSAAYYWFVQILWLKTAINLLYVFGRKSSLAWCV
jgi:hypothetical protein